jgi:hypothetical protein
MAKAANYIYSILKIKNKKKQMNEWFSCSVTRQHTRIDNEFRFASKKRREIKRPAGRRTIV